MDLLKDLEEDKVIAEKVENLRTSVQKIHDVLDQALKADTSQFSLKDRVDFDLFLTYALNTLYWMYLRTKGQDPNSNDVKNQLSRIKEYMIKAKQAHERQTIRPKVDQGAAKRFVKHGLQYKEPFRIEIDGVTPNKKVKFND